MANFIYQPLPEDADHTTVDGISFKAYEPVEIDGAGKPDLMAKLRRNPWFAEGTHDEERHVKWKRVRDAQAKAAEHRAKADEIEREVAQH